MELIRTPVHDIDTGPDPASDRQVETKSAFPSRPGAVSDHSRLGVSADSSPADVVPDVAGPSDWGIAAETDEPGKTPEQPTDTDNKDASPEPHTADEADDGAPAPDAGGTDDTPPTEPPTAAETSDSDDGDEPDSEQTDPEDQEDLLPSLEPRLIVVAIDRALGKGDNAELPSGTPTTPESERPDASAPADTDTASAEAPAGTPTEAAAADQAGDARPEAPATAAADDTDTGHDMHKQGGPGETNTIPNADNQRPDAYYEQVADIALAKPDTPGTPLTRDEVARIARALDEADGNNAADGAASGAFDAVNKPTSDRDYHDAAERATNLLGQVPLEPAEDRQTRIDGLAGKFAKSDAARRAFQEMEAQEQTDDYGTGNAGQPAAEITWSDTEGVGETGDSTDDTDGRAPETPEDDPDIPRLPGESDKDYDRRVARTYDAYMQWRMSPAGEAELGETTPEADTPTTGEPDADGVEPSDRMRFHIGNDPTFDSARDTLDGIYDAAPPAPILPSESSDSDGDPVPPSSPRRDDDDEDEEQ